MIFLAGADGPSFRRFILPGLFVLALFVVHFLRRPDPDNQPRPPVQVVHGMTMGTTFTVKIVGLTDHPPEAVQSAIEGALEAVNQEMSTYRPESVLARFNAHRSTTAFAVPPALARIVTLATEISQASGGAFDVTVGPLVDAWGFGPDGPAAKPTPAQLDEIGAHVGYDKVQVDGDALLKRDPEVRVDLSAIAKGHGVDRVADALDALDAKRYMVEVGGEIRVRGDSNAGRPWRIGVELPGTADRQVRDVIELANGAIATSGDYRNYREVDGQRVSHTIDPRTRRPIEHNLASVTVIHDDCATADAWATALTVLGPENGPKLARAQGLSVLFLVRDGETFREIETGDFGAKRLQIKR